MAKLPVGPQKPPPGAADSVEMTVEQDAAVAEAVHYVQRMYRNPKPGGPRGPRGAGGGVLEVKVTGAAISSGGSGTVTVYNEDGTTLSSLTLTAYLFLSGTVAVNKRAYVALIKGKWRIISADCP